MADGYFRIVYFDEDGKCSKYDVVHVDDADDPEELAKHVEKNGYSYLNVFRCNKQGNSCRGRRVLGKEALVWRSGRKR